MAKKLLDAQKIEQARQKGPSVDTREEEKKRIRTAIEKNRKGERKFTVIPPEHKIFAVEEAKKIRVCAYCRVSTEEDAQVGSYEMQIQHFTKVIESNPTYEMVKIYSDEGVSGTTTYKRAGFLEMLEDCKAGKIDLILTKSIARFGRNIVDILSTIRTLSNLPKPVAINFESEGIMTSDGQSKLIISILSALAELESQQKSIAVKEGIRYRMQEGIFRFSVDHTLGYYRDYTGMVKIEKAEAEIVKYIYENFIDGSSPQEIANALTMQGIKSPTGKEVWRAETIKNIIRNEKYCGDVLYQKTYIMDYLSHKAVKNKSLPKYLWEDNHPAIIKKDRWRKAQEVLLAAEWKRSRSLPGNFKRRFTVSKIKYGPLKTFLIVDLEWTDEERKQFYDYIETMEVTE